MLNDAIEAYEEALKSGEREVKNRQAKDKDPYVSSLENILKGKKTGSEIPLGLHEIPLSAVVGTRTEARRNSFAHNFMPLLPLSSEFGTKWVNLYKSQLEEGLRDPIVVYEYLNKYYVQEGNKRVSVMKYLEAPTIMAKVTRILPSKGDGSKEAKLYNEFLDFSKKSGINQIVFTQPGEYVKLDQIFSIDPDAEWTKEDKERVLDCLGKFEMLFNQFKQDNHLKISIFDAFLLYLSTYGYRDLLDKSNDLINKEFGKIEEDFRVFPNKPDVKLVTDTADSNAKKPLFNLRFEPLKVAFVFAKKPETSAWTRTHSEAAEYVKNLLKDDIDVSFYYGADEQKSEEEILDKAAQDGNDVIFTTNPSMRASSIKLAAKYPKLKILNCSLNTHTGHLRTYFARSFEIQFLFGMVAGILTKSNKIGYIADYPIYGTIANINAFALGALMTDPESKVYVDWSTTKKSMLDTEPRNIDITYISGQEFDPKVESCKEYGLYDSRSGQFYNLSKITYYWGEFYEKIIKSILNGSWKKLAQEHPGESVNYWWGLSNHMLDIRFSDELPKQTKRLIQVMKESMTKERFNPFSTELKDQEGNIRNKDNEQMDWNEIAEMDWLLENVIGIIPKLEDFSEDAKRVIRLHGVPKVKEVETSDEHEQKN